jgi:hypothetical protein
MADYDDPKTNDKLILNKKTSKDILNKTGAKADESGKLLSIFDSNEVDSAFKLDLKPITGGLGFKDRVSSGVYTEELGGGSLRDTTNASDHSTYKMSDSGVVDIGNEELGDGQIHIDGDDIQLESSEVLRPILFHSGHDGLIKKKSRKSVESFFAVTIDMMLILAGSVLTLSFSLNFLGFNSVEAFFFDLKLAALNFSAIFIALYLSYKILARSVYGKSLGEWSCRLQMGSLDDQKKLSYILKVSVREIFSVLTGILTLPLLSSLFSKDLGYYFSGVHMYVEKKK